LTPIANALGSAAMSIIPLTIALLLGLFTIRNASVVVERRTYRRISALLSLVSAAALVWLVLSAVNMFGLIGPEIRFRMYQVGVSIELLLTALYLGVMIMAVRDLFSYLRRLEER
jgi:hypothetical protein